VSDKYDDFGLTFNLKSWNGGEGQLRQIGLGLQPLLLVEPGMDEEAEEFSINVHASLMSPEEALEVLEVAVEGLRAAIERESGDG